MAEQSIYQKAWNRATGIRSFAETESEMVNYFHKFDESIAMEKPSVEEVKGWIIKNIEIFKTGTFRGIEYTEADLDEMVENFEILKSQDVFVPPFKKNHSEKIEDQIGWIWDLRRNGDYLIADIQVTEWLAMDNIRDKTWRYTSAEIYPPILTGEEFDESGISGYTLRAVAVVSVPKVKGLNGIILNSEIIEEGNVMNREELLKMLSKLGINFSEDELKELSDEDLVKKANGKVEKFAENLGGEGGENGEGGQSSKQKKDPKKKDPKNVVNQFGEGDDDRQVVMSFKDVQAMVNQFNEYEGDVQKMSEDLESLKTKSRNKDIHSKVDGLISGGKVTPAEKDEIVKFAEKLDDEARGSYFEQLDKRPKVVDFSESGEENDPHGDDIDTAAMMSELDGVETFE